MAIATTTAIALAGLAVSAGSTAASFGQAAKQKKIQREAESDATRAMAEARKKLDVNFYEQLGIQKEPYELEREALLAAGAQAIQAGTESERGAAAVAGRVQLQQQQGQRQIAAAMGQEMLGLEKATVAEESRLRDMGVGLDLGEVEGAQLASRDAQQAAAAATTQGIQGIASMAQQGLALAPLYAKTPSARAASDISKTAMGSQYGLNQTDLQKSIASMGTVNNVDLSKVASMNPMQYKDFMGNLDVNTLKAIQQQIPTGLSSFRPEQYALPTSQQGFYNPFAIPGIGG
jgi:hypothetical protein